MSKMVYLFEKVRIRIRKRLLMIYRTRPITTRFAALLCFQAGKT